MKTKKAAIEMSMTTIITIVLSVVFLILALVVLRNMYGFQSESIGSIQEKTLKQINELYLGGEETGEHILVQLGSDKVANIRAGNANFGIGIIGITKTGQTISDGKQLMFKIWLDEESTSSCVKLIGKTATTNMFKTKLNEWIPAEEFSDASGGIVLFVGIDSGTRLCTQKVFVNAMDYTVNPEGESLGQVLFTINVLRKALF